MRARFYLLFSKNWFWFGFALKLILLACFVFTDYCSQSHLFLGIAKKGGDYGEQFNTIDNLVDHGIISINGISPYAGRTPGFIFPYYFFRALFSKTIAWQLQILLQILFNILAAGCMYKLVLQYTQKNALSVFAFLSVCVVNYVSWIDFELSPESLAISTYIMGLFFFNKYLIKENKRVLCLSGVLMGWSFFLRGFTIPYAVIFLAALFYVHVIKQKKQMVFVKSVFIFFTPFVIYVACWTIRNYNQFKEIIPLQNTYVPGTNYQDSTDYGNTAKYSIVQVRKLVCAWGGDCLWYYPGTEMNWVLRMTDEEANNYRLPPKIFCKGFTEDSLRQLRLLVNFSLKDGMTNAERGKTEQQIITKSNNYLKAFKIGHPFIFAASAALRDKNFFNKNTVADWPVLKGSLFYYYKTIPLLLYYITVILALVGSLWLLFTKKLNVLVAICLGHIFVLLFEFGFLIELIHYRYFASAYMACVFVSLYFISKVIEKRKAINQSTLT